MGTRGLMGFAYDGELKGQYVHFDAYPDGLGADIAKWIKTINSDTRFRLVVEKFKELIAVDEDVPATEDQKLALLRYYDPKVSTGSTDDWYALLRNTQGDPDAMLTAGFYIEGMDFARNSLFCEWAYVVDLDRKVLEVYKGFQKSPPTRGRWAGEGARGGYCPVELIKEYSFEEIQSSDGLMQKLEEEIYGDD